MDYTIIAIEDDGLANNDVWHVFDRRCTESLSSENRNIAICLRAEMGSGLPLLDWLELWHAKFQKERKSFHIITDDPKQIESIELSSPDQNLVFFSSVNDYEAFIKGMPQDLKEQESVKTKEKPSGKDGYLQPLVKEEVKEQLLNVGDTVAIAGEYVCLGCGVNRMWIKGKEVAACKNPECFEPFKGWKLNFDLF